MPNNTANVVVGKPGNGISVAPTGTTLPTTESSALNAAFKSLGYCSDDGLTESEERSVDNITAWGGDTVGSTQTDFGKTFGVTLIEYLNAEVQSLVRGSGNVTTTAATSSSGAKMTVLTKSTQPGIRSIVVDIVSGTAVVRHVIPRGRVTELGDTSWTDGDPAGLEVTITAYPDSSGVYVYTYTNDGVPTP